MRTRHLVSLISGVLILSVLLPVGLSIWLAHQQVEASFVEELNTYSSRVAIRADKVAAQGKVRYKNWKDGRETPVVMNI